ncbi:MAG: hypothetical protein ACR65R_07665 [Methylomicrobium sp.]
MKRNYIPEELTYSSAQIDERNNYIKVLCEKIQPFARDVLKIAINRHTAEESAEVLVEEAHMILREMLSESLSTDMLDLDDGVSSVKESLAQALEQESDIYDENIEAAWIERRSKDLARAVTGFWVNLAEDEMLRYEASIKLLIDMSIGKQTESIRKYKLIYSRFWLNHKEASNLLSHINAEAIMKEVIKGVNDELANKWEEILLEETIQQSPRRVSIDMRRPESLVERFAEKISECVVFDEPAIVFLKDLDGIHSHQFRRILGTEDQRKRQMEMEMYSGNFFLVCGAVQAVINFCEKDSRFEANGSKSKAQFFPPLAGEY